MDSDMNPSLIKAGFEDLVNFLEDPDKAIAPIHTDGTANLRRKTEAVRDQLLSDE
jgi:hypothetical protein